MQERIRQILEERGIYLKWHRLGLVTGLSPQSSREYYDKLCEMARERLGGNNCPQFSTDNVNFGRIETLMELGEWDWVEAIIGSAMARLDAVDVDAIAICSNTIHRVLDEPSILKSLKAPVIHIGDCVAERIAQLGLKRVGFLGTKFTMQEEFMLAHLKKSGAEIYVPPEAQWDRINSIIFNELCKGAIHAGSRDFLLAVISDMVERYHIQGVVLGCTELPLSITKEYQLQYAFDHKQKYSEEFFFLDSEKIHLEALLKFCIDGVLPAI